MPAVLIIPLAAWAVAFLLAAILSLKGELIGSWLHALADEVPVVGKYFDRAVTAVENKAAALMRKYVVANVAAGVSWLMGLAVLVRDFGEDVSSFAVRVYSTLNALVTIRLPAITAATLAGVWEWTEGAKAQAQDRLNAASTVILREVARVEGLARTAGQAGMEEAVKLRDVTIPAVAHALALEIGALKTTVVTGVLPRLEGIEGSLGNLTDVEIPDLRGWIREHAPELATIGALMAATVLPAVRLVERCSGKIRWLCTTDDTMWDEIMGDLMPALALLGVAETTRIVMELAEESVPLLREVIES